MDNLETTEEMDFSILRRESSEFFNGSNEVQKFSTRADVNDCKYDADVGNGFKKNGKHSTRVRRIPKILGIGYTLYLRGYIYTYSYTYSYTFRWV
jgi:hypothetical protein